MDLKRLSHLVCLADEGHFGRAAKRVHLSQPAFSRSIQAAESELGLKLFERGKSEAVCTPSGTFVIHRARQLLNHSRRMERDVALFREGQLGDLAIGVGPIPAATLLPLLVQEVRTRFPAVVLQVKINSPHFLLDPVAREEHDFFVADTREVPRNGVFRIQQIGRQRGGFYARWDHPLFGRQSMRTANLVPYGIASARLPQDLRELLVRLMGLPHDARFPVALECDDTEVLKRVALTTDTVMVGTDDILRAEIANHKMRALPLKDFPHGYSELGIVSLEGRSHSPIAQFAIDFLARVAAEAMPPAVA